MKTATKQGLTIRRVPLEELHVDPVNAREHGERNMASIRASLARFGQAEPLVVQKSTGRVIGGNGRLAAMRELGWSHADVVEIETDAVEATALSIALNRTAELAAWNEPVLAKVLDSLRTEDALEGVGYSAEEIDALLAELEADAGDGELEQDEAPALPEAATTRAGDLWVLGDHRLLCGDSASEAEVDRLLDGAVAHLVNMDPPYNVKVEPRSNNAIAAGLSSFTGTHHQKLDLARHPGKAKPTGTLRPKDRPLTNDFVSDEAFAAMLRAWFGNASRVLVPGRSFYIWGGFSNIENYPAAIADAGLYFSQAIIWDKQHPVLTRKDYMTAHEWCMYGWKKGAAHDFFGPANVPDLWSVKKLNHTAMVHLTEKPVELAARAMQYSSRKGENVLDLFGGSGSTMAAAEQLGRRAFLCEIDPLYADVIVQRWEKLTGREAVLDGTGETFGDVATNRAGEAV